MKIIYSLFFLVLLFILPLSYASAQVQVVEEAGITSLIDRYVTLNRSKREVSGWRLQLIASTDRQKVMDAKTEFLSLFPSYSAKWVYKAPYYKLNVGAYSTKLEALALKNKLKAHYPNAYVTKDKSIKPSEMQ